jgi:hypothetical protein
MSTLVESKPEEKLTHYAVDYTPWNGMPGKTCGNCANLIEAQELRCKRVASPILPSAWCMKWQKVPTAETVEPRLLEQSPHV